MKKKLIKLIIAGVTAALCLSNISLLETKRRLTLELTTHKVEAETQITSLNEAIKVLEDELGAAILDKSNLEAELATKDDELIALANSVATLDSKISTGTFRVTAYSPFDNVSGIENDGNPNATSTGMKPGPYVVAVDPKVIPYGSNILIIYEDGDYLLGVAGDTGGAIKGNRLDVFKWTYAEACEFGIKTAKVVYW